MKIKALIGLATAIVAVALLITCIKSCSGCSCCNVCVCADTCRCDTTKTCNPSCTCGGGTVLDSAKMPLNISVYLDLSDRLIQELTPSQAERDTSIIMYLAKKVQDIAVEHKIVGSKEHLKVFFYPAPNDSKVNLCAQQLDMDLAKIKIPKEKKQLLLSFQQDFRESLAQIYASALNAGNWAGSDIWGFFNKPVENYCIREDNRNVLVILTDGYVYHNANKQQDGNAYTYILPQTLADPNSSLMVGRKGLENLEVLILEINPKDPKQEPKMESVLLDWLHAMGVKKAYVGATDIPANTRAIIDGFFGF